MAAADVADAATLIATGVLIGAYATAIGVGGGFLIAPLLLLRHPDADPQFVTTASLSVVAVSSGLTSVVAAWARRIDGPVAGLMAAAAVPGALLGARGTELLPRDVFAAGIAALLLALAVYLAWRPVARIAEPVARGWHRELRDREGNVFVYRVPVLRGVFPTAGTSLISALGGIGGGVFYVPLATRLMRMPHALAMPTAHVVITTLAVVVVLFHLLSGHADEPLRDAPWLAIGMVASNPLGQRLHRRLGEGGLTRLLVAGLVVVSARTAWGAF